MQNKQEQLNRMSDLAMSRLIEAEKVLSEGYFNGDKAIAKYHFFNRQAQRASNWLNKLGKI